MDTPEVVLVSSGGTRIRIPSIRLARSSHLHIRADTPQLGLAVAYALFGDDEQRSARLGYEVECIGPAWSGIRVAYVSPTARSELSRFTASVAEEIALGSHLPTVGTREPILVALGIDGLHSRDPERLSGGETAKVIVAAHLMRQPQVLILDRVIDELDRTSKASLRAYLRNPPWPMVVVTTGSGSEFFLPDLEISIRGTAVELRKSVHEPNSEPDEFDEQALTLKQDRQSSEESPPLFKVRDLNVSRGNRSVLANLSFTISRRSVTWLLGPNGCGKSTLMEVLCGLLPAEGSSWVCVEGEPEGHARCSVAELAAYAPQDPEGDVTELNLFEEVHLAKSGGRLPGESKEATLRWIQELGLAHDRIHSPLSDDLQIRKLASVLAAIARARALLLLDEPTLFLDETGRGIVVAAIKWHLERAGALICATHDFAFRRELVAITRFLTAEEE